MIKINLLAERKQAKTPRATVIADRGGVSDGAGAGRNLLLVAMIAAGVLVAGGWWWSLHSAVTDLRIKHEEADAELQRLTEIRKKRDEYTQQKELLARKIDLITDLKKRQTVPVYILDKVSRSLPDFVWLESMNANQNQVTISGKATNYNSVSRFYQNLTDSGFFEEVNLGRTFEVREGVAFSLSCRFAAGGAKAPAGQEQG